MPVGYSSQLVSFQFFQPVGYPKLPTLGPGHEKLPTGLESLQACREHLQTGRLTFPAQSVCHHIQSGTPYLGQAGYLVQTGLLD